MYIYQADVWCDACGEAIQRALKVARKAPADHREEWEYDSDDYPKGPYDPEKTDAPEHCAAGAECLSPHSVWRPDPTYRDGSVTLHMGFVGRILGTELTPDGVAYARELMSEPNPSPWQRGVHALWREHYPQLEDIRPGCMCPGPCPECG